MSGLPEEQGRPSHWTHEQPSGQIGHQMLAHTASDSPAFCQCCEACRLAHYAKSLLKEASPQSHSEILNITQSQSLIPPQSHMRMLAVAALNSALSVCPGCWESTSMPPSTLTPLSLELMAAAAAAAPVWGLDWALIAAARAGGKNDGTYFAGFFWPSPAKHP